MKWHATVCQLLQSNDMLGLLCSQELTSQLPVPQGTPKISQRHLAQALRNSRPSVSPAERTALQRRFAEFQKGRQPGGQAELTKGMGKKSTLA